MLRHCCTGRGFWLVLAIIVFSGVIFVISRNHTSHIYSLSFKEIYAKFKAKEAHNKFNKYAKYSQKHQRFHHSAHHGSAHHAKGHPPKDDPDNGGRFTKNSQHKGVKTFESKHHFATTKQSSQHPPHPKTFESKHHFATRKQSSQHPPHPSRYNYVSDRSYNISTVMINNTSTSFSHPHPPAPTKGKETQQHHTTRPRTPLIKPTTRTTRKQQFNHKTIKSPITAFADVANENPHLQFGGRYKPHGRPRQKVAVLIPYKNRKFQLRMLLHHLHPLLQRQNLDYRVFVINQAGRETLNKGKLLNCGFKEVIKLDNSYRCFVFHDVDLLPEDSRCLYTCSDGPRHIATAISTHYYRYSRSRSMEGVSAFTEKNFLAVNGWSNYMDRLGAEKMAGRIRKKHLKLWRTATAICRFTSLPEPPRRERHQYSRRRKYHRSEMSKDGLSSLHYKHIVTQTYATYTNVTVEL